MRLLVLGGSGFVGRAVAEEALARNWSVTAFARGTAAPPEGVELVRGDRRRAGDLDVLEGRRFDAVVDTWAAEPAPVREAARRLAGRAELYVYMSSLSVYRRAGSSEGDPEVAGDPLDDQGRDYAQDKRGGELAALAAFGDRALLARAGAILGPWENVGRLPWWLTRIARGGEVLAPAPPDQPLQYIDVRDLARFLVDRVAGRAGGTFNVVSPAGHTTMGELLEECVTVTGSAAELCWREPEQILAAGIAPWTEMPMWLPASGEFERFFHADATRAQAAGLRLRPLAETVADTWAWLNARDGQIGSHIHQVAGVDPAKERAALGSR